MSQAIRNVAKTLVFSSYGSAITGGAAWGTRYISQIPTQDLRAAALVGALGNITVFLTDKIMFGFESNESINNFEIFCLKYIKTPSMTPYEAEKKAGIVLLIFYMGVEFLVASIATPTLATLAGRNISYGAATLFSLLNAITFFPQLYLFYEICASLKRERITYS